MARGGRNPGMLFFLEMELLGHVGMPVEVTQERERMAVLDRGMARRTGDTGDKTRAPTTYLHVLFASPLGR